MTKEQDIYLREHYPHRSTKELAIEMGLNIGYIYKYVSSKKIKKSMDFLRLEAIRFKDISKKNRFAKGHIPVNKGLKQYEFMSAEAIEKTKATRFKKGRIPHNTKQKDGVITTRTHKGLPYKVIRIKIGIWKFLHRHIWEQHNGVIQKGYNIIFKDGDTLNCELENLEMVSREENMLRNSNRTKKYSAEEIEILGLVSQIKNKTNHIIKLKK